MNTFFKTIALSLCVLLGVLTERHFRRDLTQAPEDPVVALTSLPEAEEDVVSLPELTNTHSLLAVKQRMAVAQRATLSQLAQLLWAARDDEMLFRFLCERWVQLDPVHFLEACNDPPLLAIRQECWSRLFREWVRRDVAAAWEAVDAHDIPNGYARLTTYGLASQPEETLQELAARGGLNTKLIHDDSWLLQNPQAASILLEKMPHCPFRTNAMADIADAWAEEDPQAAYAWTQTLDNHDQERTQDRVLATWAQSHPKSFMDAFSGQPLTPRVASAIAGSADELAESIGEAVLPWLDEHLTGRTRERALTNAFLALPNTDPERSQRLIDWLITNPLHRRELSQWLGALP